MITHLDQGCAFLPASGAYNNGGGWYDEGYGSYPWSSTQIDTDSAYSFFFDAEGLEPFANRNKSSSYFHVHLVKGL